MGNYIIRNGELYHYGVIGMKWGVRRNKRQYSDKEISDYRKRKMADAPTKAESPNGANKSWYKNAPKSTLVRQMRREEAETESRKKADAKRERKVKLNKVYSDFQKDLYALEKSGRGNDIDAVIKRSKQYDAEVRNIKDSYSVKVGREYIKDRFGV